MYHLNPVHAKPLLNKDLTNMYRKSPRVWGGDTYSTDSYPVGQSSPTYTPQFT